MTTSAILSWLYLADAGAIHCAHAACSLVSVLMAIDPFGQRGQGAMLCRSMAQNVDRFAVVCR